jgi:hypothetical protein
LKTSPPEWILYQEEPEVLQLHERVYHGGQASPFRQLPDLLDEQVASGAWKVTYRSRFGSSNGGITQEWRLIQTH